MHASKSKYQTFYCAVSIVWCVFCSFVALQISLHARLAVILVSFFSTSLLTFLLTQPSVMSVVCVPAGFDCAPNAWHTVAWRLRSQLCCGYVLACLASTACTLLTSQLSFLGTSSKPRSQQSAGDAAKPGTEAGASHAVSAAAGQPSSHVVCKQLRGSGEPAGQTGAGPAQLAASRASPSGASTSSVQSHIVGYPDAPQTLDADQQQTMATAPPNTSSVVSEAAASSSQDELSHAPCHSQPAATQPSALAPHSLPCPLVLNPNGPQATETSSTTEADRPLPLGMGSSVASGSGTEEPHADPSDRTHEPFLSSIASSDHQPVAAAEGVGTPASPLPVAAAAPPPILTIDIGQLVQDAAADAARGIIPSPLYTSPNHGAAFVTSKVRVISLHDVMLA